VNCDLGAETEWMMRAACRGMDAAMFFPEKGENAGDAKTVCEGCPVRAECLELALVKREQFGVWGGLSEKDRRLIRGQRARQARTVRCQGCRLPMVVVPARADGMGPVRSLCDDCRRERRRALRRQQQALVRRTATTR